MNHPSLHCCRFLKPLPYVSHADDRHLIQLLVLTQLLPCLINRCGSTHLQNQLYGQLFTYLADQDVIPIGLYRCADAKLSTRPFVFTNPPPATLLHKGDFVFVLPPPQSELSLDPDTLNYLFCVPEPTRMPSSDDAAAAVAAGGGPAPSSLTINSSMSTTSSSINSVESTNDSGVEITIEIAPEKRE